MVTETGSPDAELLDLIKQLDRRMEGLENTMVKPIPVQAKPIPSVSNERGVDKEKGDTANSQYAQRPATRCFRCAGLGPGTVVAGTPKIDQVRRRERTLKL